MRERKRVVNVGAGALARGFVLPSLTATPRGWDVVFASRYETSSHRDELQRMTTTGAVVKVILWKRLASPPPPATEVEVWNGALAGFHPLDDDPGLGDLTALVADPDTGLVVLNVRKGLDGLAQNLLAGIQSRRGEPLLVVSCENNQAPSWASFKKACDAMPGVAAVESVADRICVPGSVMPPPAGLDRKVEVDVYTERWRRWYIQRDHKGLAEALGLDQGDHADAIRLVDDLRPHIEAKRYLVNAPHFGLGVLAAGQGLRLIDIYVRGTQELGPLPGDVPLATTAERCLGLLEELRAVALARLMAMPDLAVDPRLMADEWADSTLERLRTFPALTSDAIRSLTPETLDEFLGHVHQRLRKPCEWYEAELGRAAEHLRLAIATSQQLIDQSAWRWLPK